MRAYIRPCICTHLIDGKTVFLLVPKLLRDDDVFAATRDFAFRKEALPFVGQLACVVRGDIAARRSACVRDP